MSNDLVVIETRIHEGDAFLDAADKSESRVLECKMSAGKTYLEARKMCKDAGLKWKNELGKYTKRSRTQVYAAMKIAGCAKPSQDDPDGTIAAAAEDQRQRDDRAARNRKSRDKAKNVRPETDEKEEEYQEDDFTGTVPSTEVIKPEADPVDYIMNRIKGLNREQTSTLAYRFNDHLKALGMMSLSRFQKAA